MTKYLSVSVLVLAANLSQAATYTVLHAFQNSPADGAYPVAGLVRDSAGNLYGTTENGGAYGKGSAFRLRGTAFTLLHSFCPNVPACGGDGWLPEGGLLRDSNGNLYGTTRIGGTGWGTIFKVSPAGSGQWNESVIYTFTGKGDGSAPEAGLIRDGKGNLYGTTYAANGTSPTGVVFKLSPRGSGTWTETAPHAFNGGVDGAGPTAGLIQDAQGRLYGTTSTGGTTPGGAAHGIAFRLTPSPSGSWTETVLYTFSGGTDGGYPLAGLTMDAQGDLYGTTSAGGIRGGNGLVFQLKPGASGAWTETVIYSFCAATACADGARPEAGLVMDAQGNLYGTTFSGGAGGPGRYGTIFELTPVPSGGWAETVLYSFNGTSDGANPAAGLVLDSNGNLYGTTSSGGDPVCHCGTVFNLAP